MALSTKKEKQKLSKTIGDVFSTVRKREEFDFTNFFTAKRLVKPENLLELKDDMGFVAFLNIPGKDLDFINSDGDNGAAEVIRKYHYFLNVYLDDWDVIISQLPADTTQQQISWADNVDKINIEMAFEYDDPRKYDQILARRKFSENQIYINRGAGEIITHQDYTALIHGKTITETMELREKFIEVGGAALNPTPLSTERIEMLIKLINDPVQNIDEGE